MEFPKHIDIWLLPYLRNRLGGLFETRHPRRVWVTIADHYEPLGLGASLVTGLARVGDWRDLWPRVAEDAPRDVNGQVPQYSFFYPQEEYQREVVEGIADMVRLGVGDVEVHLHHDHDNAEAFRRKITEFCNRLRFEHGLLHQECGRTVFGFIHGDWALDNSRPDGRMCGVNGEIRLLKELGCYADFTMPSIPSPTQSRIVNRIYWCSNHPENHPRSFDRGVDATVGGGRRGDLLMITGPVGVHRKNGLNLGLETGEIAGYNMPTPERVRRWFRIAPMIGDDLFIKLYTHGAADRNREPLLKSGLANLFRWISEEADRWNMEVHWATAWQMYQAVRRLVAPEGDEATTLERQPDAAALREQELRYATEELETAQPRATHGPRTGEGSLQR